MAKKTKRMALGGPVPMASRLPSGKRGEAYKSAVSGKMADAESRMAGYEAPDFKSARRSEYNANKMARRAGNAESRLSALGAKGYKKGGKVKRMADGGPVTTGGTVAPITGPMYPPTRPGYPNPPTFSGTPGGGYNAMGMGRMPGGSSSRPPRTVQTPSVSYGQAGGNDPYEEPGGLGAPAGYNNPIGMSMGRTTSRATNPNPTPVKLLRKGGKVKRMDEGGLPEDAPVTTTTTDYGKGTEGPGMYKGPYRAAPMPNPIATTRPTPGPRPPHMDKDEREAKREDRRENRDERREERRSRMRDRFEAFKDRRGGQLGFKGWNQLLSKMPEDFMAKYGDRIGDFMSERFNKAPKLGGELPPTTMKRGGRVKASAAPKRFAKGGLVKGAGCASRGVKKARIV